jgi:hypothetical protein
MNAMATQLITYQGRIRAIGTRGPVFLTDAPETALDGDGPFVLAMCLYAGAVLNGHLPRRIASARRAPSHAPC